MAAVVFTAVGDLMPIDWIVPRPGLDFVVAYYGNSDTRWQTLCEKATYAFRGKGSKFQFLWSWYTAHEFDAGKYVLYGIFDDDISLSADQIARMFVDLNNHQVMNKDAVLYSPAHAIDGKISHQIMRPHGSHSGCMRDATDDVIFRKTRFVEMTYPVLRRDFLHKFMCLYEPYLISWGIDITFSILLEASTQSCYILDHYVCHNPTNSEKNLQNGEMANSYPKRMDQWVSFYSSKGFFSSWDDHQKNFKLYTNCPGDCCCCLNMNTVKNKIR